MTCSQLKSHYLCSCDRVESRRWHLLWLVSKNWTIQQASQAVGLNYDYAKDIIKAYNQLGEKAIVNRRRQRTDPPSHALLNREQLAMGWLDIHLHHFIIHSQQYGITQPGGTVFSTRACEVRLASFQLREKEKFLYEYDFSHSPVMGAWRYWWRHLITIEAILTPSLNQTYPICTDGKGVCPPENCGGPWGLVLILGQFKVTWGITIFSTLCVIPNWHRPNFKVFGMINV